MSIRVRRHMILSFTLFNQCAAFRTFLNELLQNVINPSKCFILWSRDLKSLYSNYLQNKEQNNKVLSSPDVMEQISVSSFLLKRFLPWVLQKIRQERGLELCHDLSSLLIAPLQRITRYQLLLKELLKNSNSPNLVKVLHSAFLTFNAFDFRKPWISSAKFQNWPMIGSIWGNFMCPTR